MSCNRVALYGYLPRPNCIECPPTTPPTDFHSGNENWVPTGSIKLLFLWAATGKREKPYPLLMPPCHVAIHGDHRFCWTNTDSADFSLAECLRQDRPLFWGEINFGTKRLENPRPRQTTSKKRKPKWAAKRTVGGARRTFPPPHAAGGGGVLLLPPRPPRAGQGPGAVSELWRQRGEGGVSAYWGRRRWR